MFVFIQLFTFFKVCCSICLQGLLGSAITNDLDKIGFYKNNKISGTVWKGLMGGAFLVGEVDQETEKYSGRHVTYLYPDLKTTVCAKYQGKLRWQI